MPEQTKHHFAVGYIAGGHGVGEVAPEIIAATDAFLICPSGIPIVAITLLAKAGEKFAEESSNSFLLSFIGFQFLYRALNRRGQRLSLPLMAVWCFQYMVRVGTDRIVDRRIKDPQRFDLDLIDKTDLAIENGHRKADGIVE